MLLKIMVLFVEMFTRKIEVCDLASVVWKTFEKVQETIFCSFPGSLY